MLLGARVSRLDDISAIDDPAVRAKAAAAYITQARDLTDQAQRIRDGAAAQMLTAGWSVRRVAAEVGLSPARVQQIKTVAALNGLPSQE